MARSGEQTRQRALDVAETLFADQGYRSTTLRSIAAEVDIAQPSLYNHFETKDDLYGAVIERAFEPLLGHLEVFVGSDQAPEHMTELPMAVSRVLVKHPKAAKLIVRELLEGGEIHPIMEDWLSTLFDTATRPLSQTKLSRRARRLIVLATFNLVVGFFALGPAVSQILGDDPNITRDHDEQLRLLERFTQLR